LNTGVISDGMLPKLKNCFEALVQGVSKVCIGQSEMLSKVSNSYTTIAL
jgi:acetylglutamate kinase